MALLHRKFLGQSGPTDVLTFQHGEIFISVETARRHARAFGNSLLRELKLYIVHGLLHLHGFDDQTPSEAHKMKAAQEKILGSVAALCERRTHRRPAQISGLDRRYRFELRAAYVSIFLMSAEPLAAEVAVPLIPGIPASKECGAVHYRRADD